jgi:two-component system LytT family response regulator
MRVLIAEDEAPARRTLRTLLGEDPDIELVGETWGAATPDAVRTLRPDLLLLDVRMPAMDGFDVLRALEPDERPLVVFITAHDEHAVEAFDVRALD